MDPITATMLAVKAFAEMVTEIIKDQPVESKIKAWERWDKLMDQLDKLTSRH